MSDDRDTRIQEGSICRRDSCQSCTERECDLLLSFAANRCRRARAGIFVVRGAVNDPLQRRSSLRAVKMCASISQVSFKSRDARMTPGRTTFLVSSSLIYSKRFLPVTFVRMHVLRIAGLPFHVSATGHPWWAPRKRSDSRYPGPLFASSTLFYWSLRTLRQCATRFSNLRSLESREAVNVDERSINELPRS